MTTLTEFSTCRPARPRHSRRAALLPQPSCYQLQLQEIGPQATPRRRRRAGDLPETIELSRSGPRAASLRALSPLRLTCTAGVIWLTCEGDPHDYVLQPGDDHTAQPGDRLALLGMPMGAVVVNCA
ncbi:DUF2917 domain-containing protein [Ramlibacter tataouinensis]|uniref:DUF2917 domain-containing protein n=1 Tax=Ramlibacter tataouinensis TaxID=94132 RepID=UPI0022F380C6|nr:DUF2917 domain-containing protein [Ramlibacter tataouinensis]WBY03666.1 DUF2917 domain-containing protein [Ramlibacter tataouinensis]